MLAQLQGRGSQHSRSLQLAGSAMLYGRQSGARGPQLPPHLLRLPLDDWSKPALQPACLPACHDLRLTSKLKTIAFSRTCCACAMMTGSMSLSESGGTVDSTWVACRRQSSALPLQGREGKPSAQRGQGCVHRPIQVPTPRPCKTPPLINWPLLSLTPSCQSRLGHKRRRLLPSNSLSSVMQKQPSATHPRLSKSVGSKWKAAMPR